MLHRTVIQSRWECSLAIYLEGTTPCQSNIEAERESKLLRMDITIKLSERIRTSWILTVANDVVPVTVLVYYLYLGASISVSPPKSQARLPRVDGPTPLAHTNK